MGVGTLTSLTLTKNASRYEVEERGNAMKIRTCPVIKRLSLSDISDPSSPMSVMDDLSNSFTSQKLRMFTLSELRVITHNFSRSNMLGEGGFGPVYKGFIDDKVKPGLEAQPVAVKALDLHGNSVAMAWGIRMKIALGAAKGLAFLHEAEKPVIYRDFKTSNILLDCNYNAKLSDFGLAKDGPEGEHTHVTTRVMGTQGYAAPEYIMTGHLTTMNDVYSFGVVLLELITGKRSVDTTRARREQSLVEWARPMLRDQRKLDRIIDPRLECQYKTEAAQAAAALAFKCLSQNPKYRPTMSDVVKVLESIQEVETKERNSNNKETKKFVDKRIIRHHRKGQKRVNIAYSDSLLYKESRAKQNNGSLRRKGKSVAKFSLTVPVVSAHLCRDSVTGKSLRYAYVNFDSAITASNAMACLNHTDLKGKTMRIMWSQKDVAYRRRSGLGNLFVKNLDSSITSSCLERMFSPFGVILSCKVAEENGQSKGFGFVQFATEQSAVAARLASHGSMVDGKKLFVAKFINRDERAAMSGNQEFTNVYVKNLLESVTEDFLHTMFSQCGTVSSVVVMRDGMGRSRGFGFVNFCHLENAKKAVESLNGKPHGSKKLFVGRALRKAERMEMLKQKHKDNFAARDIWKLWEDSLSKSDA
ncbi:hypothetical protein YC2023_046532 [Brassica napus]